MARHKPRERCCICNRTRVPERGAVCFACSRRLPNLPRDDERDTPLRSPITRGAR